MRASSPRETILVSVSQSGIVGRGRIGVQDVTDSRCSERVREGLPELSAQHADLFRSHVG